MVPQLLHQHEGRCRHQTAQLIRPEACAARSVDLEAVMEFLDPVFDVSPLAVDLFVDDLRP